MNFQYQLSSKGMLFFFQTFETRIRPYIRWFTRKGAITEREKLPQKSVHRLERRYGTRASGNTDVSIIKHEACDRMEEGESRIAVQLALDERRQMFVNIGSEMFGIFACPIITRSLHHDGNKIFTAEMFKSDGFESWVKLERELISSFYRYNKM